MQRRGPSDWSWLRTAAAAAIACLLLLGLLLAAAPGGVTIDGLQPGERLLGSREGLAVGNAFPGWALAFFLGDTLFVAASLALYLALARIAEGPRPVILLAFLAGLAKVVADAAENAIHLFAAWRALDGAPWDGAPLTLLAGLALAKRAALVASCLGFALVYPSGSLPGRLVQLGLLLAAIAGALAYLLPQLRQFFPLTIFFLTLPLMIWHATERQRRVA